MIQLDLEKMGELKSINELVFSADNEKQLIRLNYQEKDLFLDINLIPKKEKVYNLDFYIESPIKYKCNKIILNPYHNLYRLITNDSVIPNIYNYDNSIKKGDHHFEISFNLGKNDIEMNIHKDKSIVEFPNQYYIVYNNNPDGTIDTNNVEEYYQLFDDGFFIHDKSMERIFTNKISADFELFIKKDNKFNHPILNSLPTLVTFDDDVYEFNYDNYGMVTRCINKSEPKQLLSRYEIVNNNYCSIHPLLYDSFKYSNIDKPLKYWAMDYIIDINDPTIIEFRRYIYLIDENNLNELIKILNSDINYPIIKIDF